MSTNTRNLRYNQPQEGKASPKVEQLSRHMKARLEEFFCVKTQCFLPEKGEIQVTMEGFDSEDLKKTLEKQEVFTQVQGNALCFYLVEEHSFEDIDYLWSVFLGILC